MYNGKAYFFIKNLQGDVIAVTDKDGETVAEYAYDAWGACIYINDSSGVGIANINPFRYRGYYLDIETGLYYLQSRYYNPTVGRFINADSIMNIEISLSLNIFAYCENNPIVYIDVNGYGKTYAIYYNNPCSGFSTQAKNSLYYDSKKAVLRPVISIKDFQNAWNSMSGDIDFVYLYLHGGTGVLYFKGETMNMSQIKRLSSKKVKRIVYLLSCHGGDGKEGNNVAWAFAKLTSTSVTACTGSVSYSKVFGKYYARKAFDFGLIKTFYYEKNTYSGEKLSLKVY